MSKKYCAIGDINQQDLEGLLAFYEALLRGDPKTHSDIKKNFKKVCKSKGLFERMKYFIFGPPILPYEEKLIENLYTDVNGKYLYLENLYNNLSGKPEYSPEYKSITDLVGAIDKTVFKKLYEKLKALEKKSMKKDLRKRLIEMTDISNFYRQSKKHPRFELPLVENPECNFDSEKVIEEFLNCIYDKIITKDNSILYESKETFESKIKECSGNFTKMYGYETNYSNTYGIMSSIRYSNKKLLTKLSKNNNKVFNIIGYFYDIEEIYGDLDKINFIQTINEFNKKNPRLIVNVGMDINFFKSDKFRKLYKRILNYEIDGKFIDENGKQQSASYLKDIWVNDYNPNSYNLLLYILARFPRKSSTMRNYLIRQVVLQYYQNNKSFV